MKALIERLADNPEGRSLLKWLTAGLGLLTGYQVADGSYGALISGIATVLVKWLEQATSNAARAKLEQPSNDPDEYDGEPLTPPDYSKIWPKQDAPTEKLARKELLKSLALNPIPLPSEKEARRESIKIARKTAPVLYKLQIKEPGKRSRFVPYRDRAKALKAYRDAPNKGYPEGTEIALIDLTK